MPIAASSTEFLTSLREEFADARTVLAFRRAWGGRRLRWVGWSLALVTVLLALLPAYVDPPAAHLPGGGTRIDGAVLPWLWFSLVLVTAGGAIGSGGGRALLPKEQAVAFPIGPVADYLGSVLLAPLNVAWLVQVWLLLALTTHTAGPGRIVPASLLVLGWVLCATVLGQACGWLAEWIRRGPAGPLGQRLVIAGVALLGALAVAAGARPLGAAALIESTRSGAAWLAGLAVLALLTVAFLVAGAFPAVRALALPSRDEARLQAVDRAPRPTPEPTSVGIHRMLVRVDRASVWRTVAVRRGAVLLAVLPVAGAWAEVSWTVLVMVPGLVGAGALLLFGVNAWSLDGRGLLWRESLPVAPAAVFDARFRVVAEVLLAVSLPGTVVLAISTGTGVRELVVLAAACLVFTAQLLSAAARWSLRHPYPVDLSSARATPAPPIVMVGHAARLSLTVSCTGLVLSVLVAAPDWLVGFVVVLLLTLSMGRIRRARRRWSDPVVRARVAGRTAS
ncbi:hypothetical protein [Nocardioides daejeonensis]|uniref:hypothetical protein n=1 Tax=Nocardioides daejeonensis TaxID=1046556 RepID=UPI0013A52D86|nr:hypothetical protein [Nocardioides daejeonensis]